MIANNTSQIESIKPVVSVIMTTYGHENTIIKAIEGVCIQQCNFKIELIVANDCSPDATDANIKNFLSTKQVPDNLTIDYTRHETNIGRIANDTFAILKAKGTYIAWCEGDDYWIDPLKLQKQVDFLEEHKDYGLVHTNYRIFHAKTGKFSDHKPYPNESRADENQYYLKTGDIRTCTVLFRASFFPKFRDLLQQEFMKNAVLGDRPFFLLISRLSKIHFINEVTSVYYITAYTSASQFEDFFRYYEFLKKVSIVNISLFSYLKIDDYDYIRDQQRKINFYDVLLSFKNKNTGRFLKSLFSKTGSYFWDVKELKQVYMMMRNNSGKMLL